MLGKEKCREGSIGVCLINIKGDGLWEVNYERNLVINVSEYIRIESIKSKYQNTLAKLEIF